jgi:uncharacterized cupin superfamily protein
MTRPILNIADVELLARPPGFAPTGAAGERYDAKMGFIGRQVGAKKLGYNVTAVPPGKRAFPFHNHQVNEEMFFVLAGSGEVRIGAETFPIRKGDIIACPAGGHATAHQIVNTGSEELRYLAVAPSSCQRSLNIQTPAASEFSLNWRRTSAGRRVC